MLGRLGDLRAPQGAAPRRPARASPAAWRSTCAPRCASARRTSTCSSGRTAIATCRRCSTQATRAARSARRPAARPRRDLRRSRPWRAAPACAPGSRIMRGCDKFCTFCIVPYVRGRERSLPVAVAARAGARAGGRAARREIVFLGQTVNAYRHDGWDFARPAARDRRRSTGIARIRFTSPHPADMTDARDRRDGGVRRRSAAAPPAGAVGLRPRARAHGARATRSADYEALVERLRAARARASRSPPTSSSASRARTTTTSPPPRRCCAASRYDAAFLFKYSSRDGTRAARWADDVPDDEKGRRLERLIALQETISAERNRALVGADVEVLVEGPARRPEGWVSGKTPHMKTVVFPGPAAPGTLVRRARRARRPRTR